MEMLCSRCKSNVPEGNLQDITMLESRCDLSDPCKPCQQLSEIDTQISDAEALLETLQERRVSLKTKRNQVHDSSIIRRVPSEIASHIFRFCISDISSDPQTHSPLFLGTICKAWRSIAWNTPQLWASISITVRLSHLALLTELSEQWLSRSGQLPLSICVRFGLRHLPPSYIYGSFGLLSDVLNKYVKRWRALKLYIPNELLSRFTGNSEGPLSLDELTVNLTFMKSGKSREKFSLTNSSPSPKRVELSSVYLKSINISWENITTLEGGWLFPEECVEVFRRAPQLVHCILRDTYAGTHGHELEFPMPETPIIHQLRVLETHQTGRSNGGVPTVIDSDLLPSLEKLTYNARSTVLPIQKIMSFFSRSGCLLRKFTIQNVIVEEAADLIPLLRLVPSLEILDIVDPDWLTLADKFFEPFSQIDSDDFGSPSSLLLPQLQCFTFKDRRREFPRLEDSKRFSWSSFARLFTNLRLPNSETTPSNPAGGRPLRKVSIELGIPEVEYIDEDVLSTLLEACRTFDISLNIYHLNAERDMLAASMAHHRNEASTPP